MPTKFKVGFLGRRTHQDQGLKGISRESRPLDLVGRSRGRKLE